MKITYIHHSSFLVETDGCYYLFDYEKGTLPKLEVTKPILVFSSHGHHDHYNPQIFSMLENLGMQKIYAVLSDDIEIPVKVNVLSVASGAEYDLWLGQKLTTFESTDLGVTFLLEDVGQLIYHAGDLNDWVWEEESADYNEEMTKNYRKQIHLLAKKLEHRKIDAAFVVLDPRQEQDYARGMCWFLEQISGDNVYPMHYWEQPEIMDRFLREYPQYEGRIQKTE